MRSHPLCGARAALWWLLSMLLVPTGAALASEAVAAHLTPEAAVSAALLLHPQVQSAVAELQAAEAWLTRSRSPLSILKSTH